MQYIMSISYYRTGSKAAMKIKWLTCQGKEEFFTSHIRFYECMTGSIFLYCIHHGQQEENLLKGRIHPTLGIEKFHNKTYTGM